MKTLRNYNGGRVILLPVEVPLPEDVRWLAIDSSGEIAGYTKEPALRLALFPMGSGYWQPEKGDKKIHLARLKLAQGQLYEVWADSLVALFPTQTA